MLPADDRQIIGLRLHHHANFPLRNFVNITPPIMALKEKEHRGQYTNENGNYN